MRLSGMRIAYVLEATAGGTRKHLRELAFGMLKEGAELLVAVSPGRESDYHEDIAAFRRAGMAVEVIPMRRSISPLRDAWCAARLLSVLRRFRPQVVHSHAAKAGGLARSLAPLLPKTAFVHTPHTLPFEWARQPWAALYRSIEARLGLFTAAFVALTEDQKRRLVEAGAAPSGEKVAVIPNGVEARPAFPRRFVRENWGVGESETLALQVTRLAPQKACGTLLDAAARLEGVAGLRFVLVGDGPLRADLEAKQRSLGLQDRRFLMTGYLPKAWMYFPGADLAVLTSLYEGLPYVVLEAMALGVAVIAPDIPGMSEVISDGDDGLLVPTGDAEALADAVARLAGSAGLRAAMGRKGREKACGQFRLDRFLATHVELYLGCV